MLNEKYTTTTTATSTTTTTTTTTYTYATATTTNIPASAVPAKKFFVSVKYYGRAVKRGSRILQKHLIRRKCIKM